MADVMEQRGCDCVPSALGRQPLPKRKVVVNATQTRHETNHDVRGSNRVGKARVISTRVCQRSQPQLADTPQALHLACFEKLRDQAILLGLESNQAVHGVAQDHVHVVLDRRTNVYSSTTPPLRGRLLSGRGENLAGRSRTK